MSFSFSMAHAGEHDLVVGKVLDCVERNSSTVDCDYGLSQEATKSSKKREVFYSIAAAMSSIRYREPSLEVQEKGQMYGVEAAVTYLPQPGSEWYWDLVNMYRLEMSFSYGQVDYNGSNYFTGINDYLFDSRGLAGKVFYFHHQATALTPYLGVGYRQLFDTLYENKPGGYSRRIQYLYLPVGLEVKQDINQQWAISADAEYDFLGYGRVTSYLGELGLADITNPQRHGFGIRGSIKFIRKFDYMDVFLEPYIRYWHIRNSTIKTSQPFTIGGQQYVFVGYEPNNNSLEMGGRLGVDF